MLIYAKWCTFKGSGVLMLIKTVAIYFNKVSQEHKRAKMAPKLTEEYTACCFIFCIFWPAKRGSSETKWMKWKTSYCQKRGQAANHLLAPLQEWLCWKEGSHSRHNCFPTICLTNKLNLQTTKANRTTSCYTFMKCLSII